MLSIVRKNSLIFIAVTLSSFGIIGCSTNNNIIQQPRISKPATKYILADRNTLLMRGYSSNFVDGYLDGCQSGQNAAGDSLSLFTKDDTRATDTDYLIGWKKGHNFCYRHMLSLIKHSGSYDPEIYNSQEAIEQEKERIWSELKK